MASRERQRPEYIIACWAEFSGRQRSRLARQKVLPPNRTAD